MRIHRPRVVGDSLAPYSNDLPSQTHVSTHSRRASPTVPRSGPHFCQIALASVRIPHSGGRILVSASLSGILRAMLLLGEVGVAV